MPNWCDNKLTVTHKDDAMVYRFVDAYTNNKLCSEFLPPIGEDTVEWRVANWGQKWDIGPGKNEEYGLYPTVVPEWPTTTQGKFDCEASVSFSSAWQPPLGLYERLVVLGFHVQASYFEPGMSFAGTWANGIEDYYEGSWEDFPEELQNIFNMHEYYDDMEEV